MILTGLLFPGSGQAETTRQIMERPGMKIEVLTEGRGPMVVLIPSLGRGAEDFDDLAGRLAGAGYLAVRPQPRGIGLSDGPLKGITLKDLAADMAAVIEFFKGQPAVVIGHAFGNRVARMLAADRPELVKAVVLLAAGGKVPIEPSLRASLAQCFVLTMPDEKRIEHIRKAFFAPGNDPAVWLGGWFPKAAGAQSAATQATPLESWWSGGQAPILVVQPMADAIAPPANAQALREDIGARVTVVEIANAGHALLPEQPEAVAKAVVEYIKSH